MPGRIGPKRSADERFPLTKTCWAGESLIGHAPEEHLVNPGHDTPKPGLAHALSGEPTLANEPVPTAASAALDAHGPMCAEIPEDLSAGFRREELVAQPSCDGTDSEGEALYSLMGLVDSMIASDELPKGMVPKGYSDLKRRLERAESNDADYDALCELTEHFVTRVNNGSLRERIPQEKHDELVRHIASYTQPNNWTIVKLAGIAGYSIGQNPDVEGANWFALAPGECEIRDNGNDDRNFIGYDSSLEDLLDTAMPVIAEAVLALGKEGKVPDEYLSAAQIILDIDL